MRPDMRGGESPTRVVLSFVLLSMNEHVGALAIGTNFCAMPGHIAPVLSTGDVAVGHDEAAELRSVIRAIGRNNSDVPALARLAELFCDGARSRRMLTWTQCNILRDALAIQRRGIVSPQHDATPGCKRHAGPYSAVQPSGIPIFSAMVIERFEQFAPRWSQVNASNDFYEMFDRYPNCFACSIPTPSTARGCPLLAETTPPPPPLHRVPSALCPWSLLASADRNPAVL